MRDPVLFAVPFFLLLLILEWTAARKLEHLEDPTPVGRPYRAPISAGRLGQHLDGPGIGRHHRRVEVPGAARLRRDLRLPGALAPFARQWYTWVIAIVGVDLLFYTYHRIAHRVRLIWATHQAHHSSEYFNFATALRQKWNNSGEILMWIPLPLLGVPPWMVFASFSVNLVYQFWVHTERIDKLWRPFEFVFNTPSHHRVHHGMDPEYLDKNYGGILIIWDRLFGTFQPELFRPHYGLTKPVDTFNIWKLQTHEYAAIARDVRSASRLRDRLGYVFGPPGWAPRPGDIGQPRAPAIAAEVGANRPRLRVRARTLRHCGHRLRPPRRPGTDRSIAGRLRVRFDVAGRLGSAARLPGLSDRCAATCWWSAAGYAGLWTALHAAARNPGRRITLIEAERVGWAASGRNGGFVDASLTHGAENGKSRWPTSWLNSTRWAWRTWTACRARSSSLASTWNGSAPACCRWPPKPIRSIGCAMPQRPARGGSWTANRYAPR